MSYEGDVESFSSLVKKRKEETTVTWEIKDLKQKIANPSESFNHIEVADSSQYIQVECGKIFETFVAENVSSTRLMSVMPKLVFCWILGKREIRKRKKPGKDDKIEPQLSLTFFGHSLTKGPDIQWLEESATVKFLVQPSGMVCVNNTPVMLITQREKELDIVKYGRKKLSFEWTICELSDIDKYLDDKGSLTLDLKMIFRFQIEQKNPGLPKGHDMNMTPTLMKQFRNEALSGLASLLNDKATSDITISVMDGENEVGKFYCHTKILAARSPVFRVMFEQENTIEKETGVVKILDVSFEVMHEFLTFIYTGNFDKKRMDDGQFTCLDGWIGMIPELVYVADKYDVKALKEVGDMYLNRIVTPENAIDAFKLANRHTLTRSEEILRRGFRENVDKLLDTLLEYDPNEA